MPFCIVSEKDYQRELASLAPPSQKPLVNISGNMPKENNVENTESEPEQTEDKPQSEAKNTVQNTLEIHEIKQSSLRSDQNAQQSPNNLELHTIKHGRGAVSEVPESLRAIIAEEKILGTSAADLSRAFGISPSSISAYANGATSTATYNQPVDHLTQVRTKISKRASSTLNAALRALSTKDLNAEKSKDLSAIAKDMATVFEKISPVIAKEGEDKHLHLHMYAPAMKTVDDYEVIDV